MSVTFDVSEQSLEGGAHVIAITGEVDLFTSPQLKERLTRAIDAGSRRLIVDLSETTFLDSSALGTLIGAQRRVREHGGRLALVYRDSEIARTMELTGLDQVFVTAATRDDAEAVLASPAADS